MSALTAAEKAVLDACAFVEIRTGTKGAAITYEDASRIAEAELDRRQKHEPAGFFLVTAAEKAILVACAAVADPLAATQLEAEFVWAAEMARREGA